MMNALSYTLSDHLPKPVRIFDLLARSDLKEVVFNGNKKRLL